MKTPDTEAIFQKAHGNRRLRIEPHVRTKPSVLKKIHSMGSSYSAKHIIQEIEKEAGGLAVISSLSLISRDRQQIYNQLNKVKGRVKSRSTRPSKAPELNRLLAMQQNGGFLKDVKFSVRDDGKGGKKTASNTFAASDNCISWMRHFCTGHKPKAVAGIDMTYKLGPFYLTTVTFPNPIFAHKNDASKHPTTLGAIMTSVTKEEGDYDYLGRCLQARGVRSLTFGTDGECAMEKGLECVYPLLGSTTKNIHLRCFDHAKTDIVAKLTGLGLKMEERKEILEGILGDERNGCRRKGLVDCETEEEFEEKYVNLEVQWPDRFSTWMRTYQGSARSLKDTIKVCILKPVRIAAGLGNPPNKWSNQRTESLNLVIKEQAANQVTDQTAIHEIIEERVVKQQESEYTKAIFNMGEYRLSPAYERYAVSPLQWTQKTPEQQQEHIKKVFGAPVTFQQEDNVITRELSVRLEDSRITSLGAAMLNQIWKRAGVILSNYQVLEVGRNTFCVTQFGGSDNVHWQDRASPRCQCATFRSTAGLCPHVLVVAEKKGELPAFLARYNGKVNKSGKVVHDHIPKRAGGKVRGKKKRRGANNVQLRPIAREEERLDSDLDYPKPQIFTEIWHNNQHFKVVFTKSDPKAKKCESCKIEFPKGELVCIPFDIAVRHQERYYYPQRDSKGNLRMKPTWNKEAARFYCVKKTCLLQRHPYFWNGLLRVDAEVASNFKEGHLKLLKEMLHFSI